jgi:hypothetical protein
MCSGWNTGAISQRFATGDQALVASIYHFMPFETDYWSAYGGAKSKTCHGHSTCLPFWFCVGDQEEAGLGVG